MSVFPNMTIIEYYGLVDVHLIRRIYLHDEYDSHDLLEKSSYDEASEI